MSGPKISRYELIQAEKYRLRMRVIKTERLKDIKLSIAELTELAGNDNVGQAMKDKIDELLSTKMDMDDSAFDIQTYSNTLKDCQMEITKQIRLQKDKANTASALLDLQLDLEPDMEPAVDDTAEAGLSRPIAADANNISGEICEIKFELEQMSENETLPGELKAQISVALGSVANITDSEYLKNFKAVTLQKIKKSYKEFVEAFEAERLEKLVLAEEQEYIAAAIDEVIVEMGYELLGGKQVLKKSGKLSKSELYAFDHNTSLLVTYSDDGKIAMEIGAPDNEDREPTEHEKARLAYDMEQFCGNFSEIEEKLAEKGIILKDRVAMFPPTVEYAQIFNTTDFEMTEKEAQRKKKAVAKTRYLED